MSERITTAVVAFARRLVSDNVVDAFVSRLQLLIALATLAFILGLWADFLR
jgi:hypothetical protein